MDYPSDLIQAITDRVGWALPAQPTSVVLDVRNTTSTSGRLFSSYHALATVENVQAWMTASDVIPTDGVITSAVLNDFLYQLKQQSALKALDNVFQAVEANVVLNAFGDRIYLNTDYAALIASRSNILDCALGNQVAYDVLGLGLTSSRSNHRERVVQDRGALLVAQQGWRDANGVLISDGVLQTMQACIARTVKILFPQDDSKKNILRNASFRW